ncbi:MAG: TIGR04100 family radical SAM protein [Clostridia bacterium]|nr:TIGR04100 family radical SAM protein [Clostridia bacterium]
MEKKMEILYKVHNNLYINLTNRCPYSCTFCLRQKMDKVGESDTLWLLREPTAEEVIEDFKKWDVDSFDEIVFCGFGEPTEAFDVLKKVAEFIKSKYNKSIRLNTNGVGNLINKRNIAPELKGLIDTVSISLNNPDPEEYAKLVRSKYGEKSFQEMINFAKECKKYVPNVVMSTVDTTISHEEEKKCKEICDEVGAVYRIRPWED